MKILAGGCRVYSAEDGQVVTLGNWTARAVISHESGAQRITQTVSDYAPGVSPAVVNPGAEEVLYVGWIPPSKAPVHYHAYEEGIFILEGRGMVHTDDESCEFGPGSSIYFPIGVRHCVENLGNATIKLLGAFYPSGSPGEAYEPGEA